MANVSMADNGSEPVIIRDVPYFEQLASVLEKYDARLESYVNCFIVPNHSKL